MQCPTCGSNTPGTLGKCSNCEAPIDVYSVGPAAPLGAPLGAPAREAAADALGDRTMMVPPPSSWSPEPASVSTPPLGAPPVPPVPPAPAVPAPGTLAPADSESTAAWTFDPGADSGGYDALQSGGYDSLQSGGYDTLQPSQPSWMGGVTPPPTPIPAAPAVPAAPEPAPEPESIVPESWFAQPRKPQEPEAEATQVWTPQPAPSDQAWGAPPPVQAPATMADATALDGATQFAPGPMGAPPLDAPMGAVPLGGVPDQGTAMLPAGSAGQGGPPYAGYPGQGPARSGGGTSKPLLVVVSALVTVAIAAVAFVMWPSGGDGKGTAKSSPTAHSNTKVAQTNKIPNAARQQAGAMNAVLNASVDTRRVLAGALGQARTCKDLPQAIQGFQTVAQRRQNQIRRTKNLKLDKLSNGERLRASLNQALAASLQVDQVLLQWAQRNQAKCKGKPRPDAAHVPGRAAAERRATLSKRQFVVLWNPVARSTGQPQRSWQRV
ncbi:hypothetical protein AGRA3207_005217 [Actinomadura graeca]|uniref:Uncharacterized protein n=1 Tax=Actinomadura graeca TaxID=2750812 RepID=A0ABX8R1X8_9ACTN|nr:hypothetical protein [Actinomadura graeca]QXJ23977.1 hypothetical protein AGRA3207_005217 [Actinomadura graeca]